MNQASVEASASSSPSSWACPTQTTTEGFVSVINPVVLRDRNSQGDETYGKQKLETKI
jgi:hypothetical protein